MKKLKENIILFLSLFTSLSTLLCCALPALLILLGFGAVFAGLTASIPQIIWLAERKGLLFSIGGILLFLASLIERKKQDLMACNPKSPEACSQTSNWSKKLLYISYILYAIGFVTAFLFPLLF
mgnify:CR=1 FL=1